jgi:hypothetical protein
LEVIEIARFMIFCDRFEALRPVNDNIRPPQAAIPRGCLGQVKEERLEFAEKEKFIGKNYYQRIWSITLYILDVVVTYLSWKWLTLSDFVHSKGRAHAYRSSILQD